MSEIDWENPFSSDDFVEIVYGDFSHNEAAIKINARFRELLASAPKVYGKIEFNGMAGKVEYRIFRDLQRPQDTHVAHLVGIKKLERP